MKGKIFLFVFALPFFAVGAWMAYLCGSDFADAWRMQSWHEVEATLTSAGYTSHSGDSTTYEAHATYTYEIHGFRHTGDRVGLSGGADNIGDYQQDTGRRLQSAWSEGRPITVFVNPDDPADSIVDREIRWGLIGFRSVFVLAFGGTGLGMMFWAVRAPRKKDPADPRYADAPWLANDAWQTNAVRSSSKLTMYGAWGFALFWNAVSAPLPFVIHGEVLEKQNYIALVGLLFPTVGAFLLVWAFRRTREWQRFGAAPVSLDPFPGSIGGHVGGTIDIRLPYDTASRFKLTLTNIKSYVSGSGKNRSRRESAKWQDSQLAFAEPGGSGTRLTFRFDVPSGLRESVADPGGGTYYLWRLNVSAALDGADFDRDYEIPVYATAQRSAELAEHAVEKAVSEQQQFDEASAIERMHLQHGAHGRMLHYPAGRNRGSSLGGALIGGVFMAVGWYIASSEGRHLFGGVFGGMGALVATACLYTMSNSLTVWREAGQLVALRRVLGIPVRRRQLPLGGIDRFSSDSRMQSQSGGKHRMHYSIYAHDLSGDKLCVGEGFQGESEASAAIRVLCREFSITPLARDAGRDSQFDALAADN